MLNVSDFQQPDAYSRLPGDWLSAVSSPTANGLNRLILVFPMLTVTLSIVPIILLPRIVRLSALLPRFFFHTKIVPGFISVSFMLSLLSKDLGNFLLCLLLVAFLSNHFLSFRVLYSLFGRLPPS